MVQDAGSLADFVALTGHAGKLRVEESFGGGFVRLRVDEAERRQAKHDIRSVEDAAIELLRNARDAGAHTILLATTKTDSLRTLTAIDDGSGIPESMWERIFDARVTSKLDSMHMDAWGVHGRGMALFSIRQNAQSAKVMASAPGKGTAIQAVFDTETIQEKADQSSWPEMGTDDAGKPLIERGPHNICRTCCEFAIEDGGDCEVYVGSAAEVIAAARRRVRIPREVREKLLTTALSDLSLLQQLRLAADAQELAEIAGKLGLAISERTAHRILAGEIRPAQGAYAWCCGAKQKAAGAQARHKVDLAKDSRGLKIADEDIEQFQEVLAKDFQQLAERYYLVPTGRPEVRVSSGKVQVSFDFMEED